MSLFNPSAQANHPRPLLPAHNLQSAGSLCCQENELLRGWENRYESQASFTSSHPETAAKLVLAEAAERPRIRTDIK